MLKKINIYFLIPFFFLVIYAALPTRMYYSDGLDFAYFLERPDFGPEGLHPHHPLFLPFARLLYELTLLVLPSLRAIKFLAFLNAIFGALGIFLFMKLMKAWGESNYSIALGGAFLGSSFTYWHYSTDSNAYMMAFAVALWSFHIYFARNGPLANKRAIMSGVVMGVAVLVHELAIFAALGLFYYMFCERVGRRAGIKSSLLLFASFITMIIVASILDFIVLSEMSGSGLREYLVYLTSHARARYFWTIINKPIVSVMVDVARSHTNLFIHLKPQEIIFYDQIRGDTPTTIIIYRGFTAISALIALASLILIQFVNEERRSLIRTHFVWLAVVFGFTCAFMPVNNFYRIFYLPPLIMVWGQFLKSIPGKILIKIALVLVLLVFFSNNLTSGIIPDRARRSNPYFDDTARINRFVGKDDLVIFPAEDRYRAKFYRYFGKGNAMRVTQRIAYLDYWTDIWPRRQEFSQETMDYLKTNFKEIFISEKAWAAGEEYILLARYNLPGPFSRLMMIEKERLIVEKEVMGPDGVFFKVRVE